MVDFIFLMVSKQVDIDFRFKNTDEWRLLVF